MITVLLQASADLIDVDPVKQTDTPPVEEEKSMYELQLTQLQEQLVSAMIENQNLSESSFIYNI